MYFMLVYVCTLHVVREMKKMKKEGKLLGMHERIDINA
jgi:hypothetical protein